MKRPRRFLTLALFFVTVHDGGALAQEKIRVGLSSVSALHSAMWVAEQKGFFRRQGLDTEIIVTGQGATTGIGALLANDIQFACAAGDSLVNATLRGGETVMIAAGVNRGLNRIMVRPEIKTPADLKGKKIGVTRIGAVSHSVLLMMLKRWNINPADVQVLQLGSSPNMLQGLEKGGMTAQ
jgi:NitT/TauT family transport system substrate-binding protein